MMKQHPHGNSIIPIQMWLGGGVPTPDRQNLEGCGCRGRCDPKSRHVSACDVNNSTQKIKMVLFGTKKVAFENMAVLLLNAMSSVAARGLSK